MFCLFRNSKIHPRLDKYAILASLLSVFAWLYFAFVEKSLMSKLFEGKALIVDLVFGLPLVLAMAIVVYALVYWSLKLIVIFLIPQAIINIEPETDHALLEEEMAELEEVHGKEYWNKLEDEKAESANKKQTEIVGTDHDKSENDKNK